MKLDQHNDHRARHNRRKPTTELDTKEVGRRYCTNALMPCRTRHAAAPTLLPKPQPYEHTLLSEAVVTLHPAARSMKGLARLPHGHAQGIGRTTKGGHRRWHCPTTTGSTGRGFRLGKEKGQAAAGMDGGTEEGEERSQETGRPYPHSPRLVRRGDRGAGTRGVDRVGGWWTRRTTMCGDHDGWPLLIPNLCPPIFSISCILWVSTKPNRGYERA